MMIAVMYQIVLHEGQASIFRYGNMRTLEVKNFRFAINSES